MLVTACFLLVGLALASSTYIRPITKEEHERKVIDCPGIDNEHRQDLYENARYANFDYSLEWDCNLEASAKKSWETGKKQDPEAFELRVESSYFQNNEITPQLYLQTYPWWHNREQVRGFKKFGCHLGVVGDERVHRKFVILCHFK
ncbi:hypothetical protein OESDEN_23409 [Oesophagostomum dentatum]|uniref:SCP domain-containing protein n=1 Tax=Oesophagostomum dentatum TaxID=61180 RepID=A0A0B1RZ89_OESDE|nr:hypothetical protein OESDEN_23409 [Oesophagostomum dentatum]